MAVIELVCTKCGATLAREDDSSLVGKALVAIIEGDVSPTVAVGHTDCPKRVARHRHLVTWAEPRIV